MNFNSIITLLLFTSFGVVASDRSEDIDNINKLISESIRYSYKVNSIQQEIFSSEQLYDAAKYYYVPSATISSEVKQKFDRPGHPSTPLTDFSLTLEANLKLWSNTTDDDNKSSYYKLQSDKYRYNAAILDVYKTINSNLIKIELSRQLLFKSNEYKNQMGQLILKMEKGANTGVLKKSDRLFADVTMKKFEESIYNAQSKVEGYKNEINNVTSRNLYNDGYKIPNSYVDKHLNLSDEMFEINNVIKNNFDISSRKYQIDSDKYAVEATNENFLVEIVTKHEINENELSNKKGSDNTPIDGYTYDSDGNSYIGLKLTFTGLNFGSFKNKESEKHLLTKKMIDTDEFIHQKYVDLKTYEQQYYLVRDRVDNIGVQIELTKKVIVQLMKEIGVDESNALDLFRNISSLSDLESSQLLAEIELLDIVMNVKQLNADIPRDYVIK
ncbi:TolC family protein [Enterovibrio nigricans]|uniref:Outer membrane efflux protein n=1 Tax=Enterovibrio nigricans DSM 22720 TaxID=1121868 RepID=A0A1T4UJJ9_9GAMM|nr:TolC family protein [Enterovibrio nigricans]PKF51253.1 hypothetical protein AT251_05575 [Enterovibrio nigricans]SKA52776.1 Outer membrane efflux protein [Enterovibrio nigricans DSM 22720]